MIDFLSRFISWVGQTVYNWKMNTSIPWIFPAFKLLGSRCLASEINISGIRIGNDFVIEEFTEYVIVIHKRQWKILSVSRFELTYGVPIAVSLPRSSFDGIIIDRAFSETSIRHFCKQSIKFSARRYANIKKFHRPTSPLLLYTPFSWKRHARQVSIKRYMIQTIIIL